MTPQDIVRSYFEHHYRVVIWPAIADLKGPTEKGWTQKQYSITDYHEGDRVGVLTGTEITPDHFLHDVDIDWAPGSLIAQSLLPLTSLVFGRKSKKVSHCFYTLPEPLPSMRYEDIDKTCLIELRGTKANGEIGLQTMVPPSVWSKNGEHEPVSFVRAEGPTHVETSLLKNRVCYAACAMILAKHLGINGFGHEPRLAWAGFFLRAGVGAEDLIAMGEAISVYCNNREVADVRRAVESTIAGLAKDGKKVKGGPSLIRILGTDGRAIINRINDWLGRSQDFVRDKNGHILPKHQGNIKRAIEILGVELSYNEFSDKLLYDKRPLEDPQWMGLYLKIDREFHFQPPLEFFKMVIKDLAWNNGFHPVKEYLESLKWDGQPRIDEWLITAAGVEDTEYVRAISSIMMIAAVRRIKAPGCKYDEMVVWESAQGADKSSAAQSLCPNSEWFSDDLPLDLPSQQLIEATLGKWIIEASDLSGKKKAEIDQLKAMLSRQVDGPARMAYAHFPIERARQFIYIGTTNSPIYLNDPTGARRFWPIKVQRFNIPWIKENRDQLWAEACVREAAGESIRLKEELWPAATEEQEKRREIDPWEDIIRTALVQTDPGADGKRRIPTGVLWDALGVSTERRDRYGALRISEIMQRLGYRRTRVRTSEGDLQVGYVQERFDESLGGEVEEVSGTMVTEKLPEIPF